MSRMIVMTEEQLQKVMIGANVLSNALHFLDEYEAIEIIDLDGDPDPGARERWSAINKEAHDAIGKARYLDEFLSEPT